MSDIDGGIGEEDRLAHLRDGELAGFLDGKLSTRERARVEAHVDICETCRSALVDTGRAVFADVGRTPGSVPLHRRWWVPALAAAGVAAILLTPRLITHSPSRTDSTSTRATRVAESEGRGRIAFVSPADDATVTAARIVFTWHAVPADVYRVALLTVNGDSVWSTETIDTNLVLPATVPVQPGGAYFWRVDAVANGIVATTKAHRFQVAR